MRHISVALGGNPVFATMAYLMVAFCAALIFFITTGTSFAQPVERNEFKLRDGVVVQRDQHMIYLMNAKGGIDAVELREGGSVWSTKTGARPLTLNKNVLIAQTERAEDDRPGIGLTVLDTLSGRKLVDGFIKTPASVHGSVSGSLAGRLDLQALVEGGRALVSWAFHARKLRGAKREFRGRKRFHELRDVKRARPTTGVASLDLETGGVSKLTEEEASFASVPLFLQKSLDAPEQRIPDVPGIQLLSADERHVMTSQRIDNDSVWEKYLITIFSLETRKPIAKFRSHNSLSPFFVDGPTIVLETGPYERKIGTHIEREPLKIRALDLESGKELWSREIRDTTYRGPFPP